MPQLHGFTIPVKIQINLFFIQTPLLTVKHHENDFNDFTVQNFAAKLSIPSGSASKLGLK